MTVREELQDIVSEAKAWRWTPELFDRVRNLLNYVNVFNVLRRELTLKEYQQFDLEYCEYIRPGQREFIKWLIKEREVRECREKEAELLNRKRQLLKRKLQTLTDN